MCSSILFKMTVSMKMGAKHEEVQEKERIHENPDKTIINLKKREQSIAHALKKKEFLRPRCKIAVKNR